MALGQAVRSLVSAGDAYTASLGRLAQATGSIERARDLYETLYRNALQTGVAVTESVDAFQRFAIAARAIGATSDQVAQLVGGLQRAAIVGGSSAQEIGSATLQLAQALASGRLQGDELRAVLEAMPLLAEALAAELGVSVGQLRELGSEGQLTAERIFPALLRASERLNAEFERAPLTLGRAFGQLEAAAGNFLAQLDQAVGLTSALARGISGAAQALDRVRGGVGLLSPSEVLEDRRRQAQALAGEIARLEAGEFLPRRGAARSSVAQWRPRWARRAWGRSSASPSCASSTSACSRRSSWPSATRRSGGSRSASAPRNALCSPGASGPRARSPSWRRTSTGAHASSSSMASACAPSTGAQCRCDRRGRARPAGGVGGA